MLILKAGVLYFALAFGVGFVLGTIRTLCTSVSSAVSRQASALPRCGSKRSKFGPAVGEVRLENLVHYLAPAEVRIRLFSR